MTSTPTEVGTLIVVILKAKNLPNKRHIGKQDPYCSVKLGGETRRTRAIKRGGQHPEWDEEVRFTILEDVEDELARTFTGEGEEPPPPPPKKDKKKVNSVKKMLLMCYADDPREPDLIGETSVDLTEVLTKGETDEWFTLTNKEKYCGEVYLELTFWSNEKPPEKQATPQSSTFHPQYGGPGSFTPSAEIPAALKHGGSGNHNTPSPSRLPSNSVSDASLPSSLRPSGSLAKLNLYNAPYEQHNRYGDAVESLSNGISSLDVGGSSRRRESFPPGPSEFGYSGTTPLHHSGSFSTLSSTGSLSSIHSVVPPSLVGGRPSHGHHRNSLSSLPEPFVQGDYSPGHSHVMPPVSESYPPEPSYQYPHAPTSFVPSPPSHTPVPSQFIPTPPGPQPVSSTFTSQQQSSSAVGFHPPQTSQQQYPVPSQTPFQPQYPQPSPSALPNQYHHPEVSPSITPASHSAPPQQYVHHATPSPPHQTPLGLQPANAYQQMQSNPPPGSRPLPNPQGPKQTLNQPSSVFMIPPPGSQPTGPGGVMFPNAMPFQPPGPPPPPPPRRQGSLPPTPTKTPSIPFATPPPPPPPLQNGMQLPQQGSHLNTPPRPPSHLMQPYDRQSPSPSPHGQQSLSQPPHTSQGFGPFPPPPPPPSLSSYINASHPPPPPSNYSTSPPPGQQPYYPGPPPFPPPQLPIGHPWNPNPSQQAGWDQ